MDSVSTSSAKSTTAGAVQLGQPAAPGRRRGWSTSSGPAPARRRVASGQAPIDPAPTTSAGRPRDRRPGPAARAAVTTLCPARSMPVSACTRLPTRSACCMSSCSSRPAASCSAATPYASRSWPRICASPTTIESRPGRDPQRVPDGRRCRSARTGARPASPTSSPARVGEHRADLGQATVEAGDGRVHLDPVAGGEHDGLVDVRLSQRVRTGPPASGRPSPTAARAARPGRCGGRRRRRAGSSGRLSGPSPNAQARAVGSRTGSGPRRRYRVHRRSTVHRTGARRRRRPCGARGTTGSAVRSRGRPCVRRRRPERTGRTARS